MEESKKGRPLGGTLLEQVKILSNAPVRVNKDFKMPKIRIQESNSSREYVCTCCAKAYSKQDGNFLKANNSILWQGNGGYLPVCKSCSDTIFKGLVDFYEGNEEHAMRRWCAMFDYPYDVEASAMAATRPQAGKSKILLYPSKLNMPQVRKRGVTYLDTIKLETGESERIRTVNDVIQKMEDDESQFTVTKEMIRKWGLGLRPDEYEWLEEQERDWASRVENKTKPQEELIRMLCMAQLNVQEAQRGNGKIAEAMKAFQDLLGTCNLQPRQNNVDEFADQETFGTLIRMCENERPIPEPAPEWEDVDTIKHNMNVWFYGHLCNLVHITNDNEKEYREEVAKYTVEPPTYDEDDELSEGSLLDKYSNRSTKADDGNE